MDLEAAGTVAATIVKRLDVILISVCQLLALFVIAVGVSRALLIYLKGLITHVPSAEAFQQSRLTMGYAFSLGLSFLVGATILKTMNSNHWGDIAQLAAIIAVRTILNHLLLQAIQNSDRIQDCDEPANGQSSAADGKNSVTLGRSDA
jgi:uncharacterized membrane protein